MTRQLVRYAILGVLSNLAGYAIYLLITWLGVEPKRAMTALYVVGATISFIGNRQWTFSHRGAVAWSLLRFGIAHLLGYLLNLCLLLFFVDRLGYPHELVQAAAIFIVAGFLFGMFRIFVFAHGREPAGDNR